MPRRVVNSMFILRFACVEAMSGYHDGCQGKLQIHARRGDTRVPPLIPRDAMNSTFILRFTCVEAISGYFD